MHTTLTLRLNPSPAVRILRKHVADTDVRLGLARGVATVEESTVEDNEQGLLALLGLDAPPPLPLLRVNKLHQGPQASVGCVDY